MCATVVQVMVHVIAPGHHWVTLDYVVLENDIVMSSSLFMLITYYSVLTDTNERD